MRRLAGGAAAALLLTTAVACGDGSGGDGGVEGAKSLTKLQAAAAAVEDAGSSRVEMTMTMHAGIQVDSTMKGAFTYDGKAGEATVTMSAPDAPPGTPGLGGTTEMIVEEPYLYMRGPLTVTYGAAGKGWARVDMTGVPGFSTQAAQDPSQYLEVLSAAGSEPEELGTELVRGTETTHYSSEVAFEDLLEGEGMEEYAKTLQDLGAEVSPVALEAWIAADGLPRRISVDMEVSGVEGLPGEKMTMQVTAELFDYGVDVDVTPPKKFEEVTPPSMG